MNKSEAIAFLKEYKVFQTIDAMLPDILEYSPGTRVKRGVIQDTILHRLGQGSNNKLRNMITVVLRRRDILAIKYQGTKCYKNVKLRG